MPTLAGFIAFLTNIVGIPPSALPTSSPVIVWCFNFALQMVNLQIKQAAGGCGPDAEWSVYALAVYNFATDRLINIAPDQPGQTYFADLRKQFGISGGFVAGVVSESHDETTGEGLLVPDFMKNFTMSDLARLKTPYGRQYLEIAQDVGTLWGLS